MNLGGPAGGSFLEGSLGCKEPFFFFLCLSLSKSWPSTRVNA